MEEQANSQIPELTGTPIVLSPDWKAIKDFEDLRYIVSLWNLQINTTMEVFNQMGDEKKYFNMKVAPVPATTQQAPLVEN